MLHQRGDSGGSENNAQGQTRPSITVEEITHTSPVRARSPEGPSAAKMSSEESAAGGAILLTNYNANFKRPASPTKEQELA